jgi:hypothetical protein
MRVKVFLNDFGEDRLEIIFMILFTKQQEDL